MLFLANGPDTWPNEGETWTIVSESMRAHELAATCSQLANYRRLPNCCFVLVLFAPFNRLRAFQTFVPGRRYDGGCGATRKSRPRIRFLLAVLLALAPSRHTQSSASVLPAPNCVLVQYICCKFTLANNKQVQRAHFG